MICPDALLNLDLLIWLAIIAKTEGPAMICPDALLNLDLLIWLAIIALVGLWWWKAMKQRQACRRTRGQS